jgi:uncharacterized protein (DUF2267 family)
MRYDQFLQRVSELTGISIEQAEPVSRAVLHTLSERLGPKESHDTASQLPKELKDAVKPGKWPETFGVEEFVRRVAERAGLDENEALERTRAVFQVLHEAVQAGEIEDWETILSVDYVDLGARRAEVGSDPRTGLRGPRRPAESPIGAYEFLRRVGERAGLDEQRARRAAEAVLETFGERIADGEAKDLAAQLPDPVAEPLRRPGGDARAMPAEEFVRRIAEREQIPPAVAREHARAVLTTLRESVTVDEWDDTIAELPREYEALLV